MKVESGRRMREVVFERRSPRIARVMLSSGRLRVVHSSEATTTLRSWEGDRLSVLTASSVIGGESSLIELLGKLMVGETS